MCNLCWEEKNEEIAIRNGAKNWAKRKDKLLNCFSHQDKINIINNMSVCCDLCQSFSKQTDGKWHCNRNKNKDICPSCYYTDQGQDFIFQIGGEWSCINYKTNRHENFGSILDWAILFREENDGDYLLYNINQCSKNYHKLALGVIDDSDRHGLYQVEQKLTEMLEKISTNEIKNILIDMGKDIDFS
jgi:hypothetical protein